MKHVKKVFIVCIAALIFAALSLAALAAAIPAAIPAEIVAELTGRTPESVAAQKKESGKTYGSIAADAGKLDEFRAERLEIQRKSLAARVEAGEITQAEANDILSAISGRQVECGAYDGANTCKTAQKGTGAKFRFGFDGAKNELDGAKHGHGRTKAENGQRNGKMKHNERRR